MAQNKFGGECRFLMSDGSQLIMRGVFSVNPSKYSAEGMVNQNGSQSKMVKIEGYRFETTFEEPMAGNDWDRLMLEEDLNFRVVEDYTEKLHVFTSAMLVGDPQVDRSTGEVTGVTGMAEGYRFA